MSLLPVRAEIRTEPLNDATIYVEQLGSARVYHETWNIFTILDTSKSLRGDYEKTWNYLTTLEDKCGNCKEINELKQLKQIMKNVYKQMQTIRIFEGKSQRQRRGWINAIGSLSKSLFGTLDNDDLENLHKEMDKIYGRQHKLASSISNQTAIIRVLLEEVNKERTNNYDALTQAMSNETQQIHMIQAIEILSTMIQELRYDVSTLQTAITIGRHGIIDTRLLTPEILAQGITGIQNRNSKQPVWDERRDYALILNIANVAITLTREHLVYHLSIPVTEEPTYQIKHLVPLPQSIRQHHVVIIPESEWIAIDKTGHNYMQVVQLWIGNYKQHANVRYCRRIQPTYLINTIDTCDSKIIKGSTIDTSDKICINSIFKIHTIPIIAIHNGYILIPEHALTVHVICNKNTAQLKIRQPTILRTTEDCLLLGDQFTHHLAKTYRFDQTLIYKSNITLPFNTSDIQYNI